MASIRERDSGYFQAKIRRKGWPAQSKTFRTKTAAETWARSVESEMDKGVFVSRAAAERTTIKDLAKKYRDDFAPHHYRGTAWRIKLDHLEAQLGGFSIAALTPDVVTGYRDARLKDPDPRCKDARTAPRVSGSTVKTELDLLSKMLSVAETEFGISLPFGNVVRSIRKPKAGPSRERRLSAEEWQRLETECKASRNPLLHPALILSVETAMRQGELLKVQREHYKKANRYILLPQTKNGESRAVPLSTRAIEILDSLPTHASGRMVPMDKQTLYSVFKAAVNRAGIENFTWHDIRHEALSRLAETGKLSLLELASVSGHKTLQMLKKYTHMHAEQLAHKLG